MKYNFYKNSDTGLHCVQACLQTLLDYFELPVPDKSELDIITGHDVNNFTWMSKALIYLASLNLEIMHVENLDYSQFAERGEDYLKMIWDENTFAIQSKYSNLKNEQIDAQALVNNKAIKLINKRLQLNEIKKYFDQGYFTLVSINPNVLYGREGYGAHMVVITGFTDQQVKICDPDQGMVTYPINIFAETISEANKPDFSASFVKRLSSSF